MKVFTTLTAAVALVACGLTSAHAATIISDNFDAYPNQAAFDAVWVPSGTSGSLSSAQSVSPPNSIANAGGGTQRNDRTFSAAPATDIIATDSNPLVWSYQFYDDPANLPQVGNTLGRTYGQLLGRDDSGALTQLLAIGLWNGNIPKASDGVTSTTAELRQYYAARTAFSPGGNWILLDTAPQRSAGWHELKAVIGSTQVEYFVDGVSALVTNYANAEGDTGWYQARIGSGLSTPAASAFDDYRVAVVPEPASVALLALGLVGIVAGSRRRTA